MTSTRSSYSRWVLVAASVALIGASAVHGADDEPELCASYDPTQLDLANGHACAVVKTSEEEVFCWGHDYTKTVDPKHMRHRLEHTLVPLALPKGVTPKKVLTANTSCALGSDAQLYCVDPEKVETYKKFPLAAADDKVVGTMVDGDMNNICAVVESKDKSKAVQCNYGVAGEFVSTPIADVTDVYVVGDRTCVADKTKDVYCWMKGDDTTATPPVKSDKFYADMFDMSMDYFAHVAKDDDKTAVRYLGDAEGVSHKMSKKILDLSVGNAHACVVVGDKLPGDLYCVGTNTHGELGTLGQKDMDKMTQAKAVGKVYSVECADGVTCVEKADEDKKKGKTFCFGNGLHDIQLTGKHLVGKTPKNESVALTQVEFDNLLPLRLPCIPDEVPEPDSLTMTAKLLLGGGVLAGVVVFAIGFMKCQSDKDQVEDVVNSEV